MTPRSPVSPGLARITTALSFSAFFVFPAFLLGRVRLSIPVAMSAVLVVAWVWRLRTREWLPFALLLLPPALSGLSALLLGGALAPDLVPKSLVASAMSLLIVIPTRHLLREGYGEQFIRGAAYAIVVHAAVGAYQTIAFERGIFPFEGLMATYPAMAMPPESIEVYVTYVRRPFGLFAEASAMAACIGPWLVLVSMALFTRGAGHRPRRHDVLLALALGSGLALVVASKSGMAVPIVAGTSAPALWAAVSSRRHVLARGAALVAGLAIVCASSMWLLSNAMNRFRYSENESWQARLGSLTLAVGALEKPRNLLLGVGPGQSVAHVRSTALRDRVPGVTAVWSIALTYAMETGLPGMIAMLLLGVAIALSIATSAARVAGFACAMVWAAGVVFATSYPQQPALWMAMAVLLSWWSVARRDATTAQLRPEPATVRQAWA
jgi:hypothetical protein